MVVCYYLLAKLYNNIKIRCGKCNKGVESLEFRCGKYIFHTFIWPFHRDLRFTPVLVKQTEKGSGSMMLKLKTGFLMPLKREVNENKSRFVLHFARLFVSLDCETKDFMAF